MGLSIQEQLLKAGMVDKKQVKKADHEKRVKNKKKRKVGESFEDRDKLRLQQQQAERVEQDRQLNIERNQQVQRNLDLAAAQQMIAANRLPLEEGAVNYHYVASGQIRRISVDQDIAERLADGKVGLAMHGDEVILIAADVVKKILLRDKDAILAYNDPTEIEDEYPSDW